MAQFTNTATLTYNGAVINSNTTVGEIVDALTVSKAAVNTSYKLGDRITYIISIINNSSTNYTDIVITDNLGSYTVGSTTVSPLELSSDNIMYYINGVLQPNIGFSAGAEFVTDPFSVPANSNVTLAYEATVTSTAPLASGSEIENSASLSSQALAAPIVAASTISADTTPQLSITKSLTPLTVNDNDSITYTFTIENYGNTAVANTENIILSDRFTPILSITSVTYNGTSWTATTNYSYTEGGLFTTNDNMIAVNAATYTQNPTTGVVTVTPGVSTIIVTGTV